MRLKEYMKNLNAFIDEHPEALEYDVITASDEEGNAYQGVYFEPSLMYLDDDGDAVTYDDDDDEAEPPNAVCVN